MQNNSRICGEWRVRLGANKGILAVVVIMATALPALGQDAGEIVRRADDLMRGKTLYNEATMRVVRPSWTREVAMRFWAKGSDLSQILITAPARDKGTAFLKRGSEVWNWMPNVEKVIRIPPSMMMQPWMGSDFANDDLVKQSSMVTDYTHEVVGDSAIDGHACWKIRLVPKPEAAVVWGRVDLWVSKANFLELRVEYFDEEGEPINTMILSDINSMGGRTLPTRLEMIPVDKPGNRTIIPNATIFLNEGDDVPVAFQLCPLDEEESVR